ncbi:hypothetical protein BOTBODRAFT_176610 [Botryobasidium botryosum FD-172 SS1]|uniref:Defective in cullin neddylation protein n=1 Tax=Botryobasidium botryosum (strain FD-172 SS1) TaxID=930990 RepID=A0A067MLF2_BOTB1|nr:hypothetical protein BOTBODRAFT_176610 [Botryobasidium botryosum FD-172 SS1]
MPPKVFSLARIKKSLYRCLFLQRKRADQLTTETAPAAPATRSTRSSTRNAAAAPSTDSAAPTAATATKAENTRAKKAVVATEDASATNGDHPSDDEPPPPRKKAARTKDTDKSLSSAKSKGGRSSAAKTSATRKDTSEKTKKPQKNTAIDELNPQTYTPQRLDALFDKYADEPPTADTISPEGLEQLCIDAGMPMEGVLPLLLAWSVNAATMGSITKAEWATLSDLRLILIAISLIIVSQLSEKYYRIDTAPKLGMAMKDLEKILFPSPASDSAKNDATIDAYKKDRLKAFQHNPENAFQKFYSYCFGLARTEQQRNIDVQTAVALWNVLILQKYSIMPDFLAFLEQNASLKGVTKDLWNMLPEFCKSIDKDLNGYDESEAWPSLIDDFVQWKKEQQASATS